MTLSGSEKKIQAVYFFNSKINQAKMRILRDLDCSDSVTRVNDSTRVTIFGDSTRIKLRNDGDSTRIMFLTE